MTGYLDRKNQDGFYITFRVWLDPRMQNVIPPHVQTPSSEVPRRQYPNKHLICTTHYHLGFRQDFLGENLGDNASYKLNVYWAIDNGV